MDLRTPDIELLLPRRYGLLSAIRLSGLVAALQRCR